MTRVAITDDDIVWSGGCENCNTGERECQRCHDAVMKALRRKFPTNKSAMEWLEHALWGEGPECGQCGSTDVVKTKHRQPKRDPRRTAHPYWCSQCKRVFGVKDGTVMKHSNMSYWQWVIAIWQVNCLNDMSCSRLARDIGVYPETVVSMVRRMKGGDKGAVQ